MSITASSLNRRRLLAGAGAAALGAFARNALAAKDQPEIKFGYAALTWGDENAKKAMADIAAVGFRGVQLRAPGLKAFADPTALADALRDAGLAFACLSGGVVTPNPATRRAEIDSIFASAKFAKAAGALALQVTGPTRAGNTAMSPGDVKAFAATLNELGKRTAELGLPLGFHPSANQVGGRVDETEAVLAATNPAHVKLLLDTGHHAAAGGDPAKAIKKHARRLLLVHLKDVKDGPAPGGGAEPYEFLELGRGRVDFRAVFSALAAVKWSGWAVVEMRPYTVREGHSAKDGAIANKAFLEKTLGLTA
jgi:inosose dehydratase